MENKKISKKMSEKIFDDNILNTKYSLKSPDIENPQEIEKLSIKKRSPFLSQDTSFVSTVHPTILNKETNSSFMEKLGKKQQHTIKSPISVTNSKYVDDNFDPDMYYTTKTKNFYNNSTNNDRIDRLERQIEKQNELFEKLINSNKKNSIKVTLPQPESVKKETKKNEPKNTMPDYDLMDEEETAKYQGKFKTLFNQLKISYPKFGFEIPDIDNLLLSTVHEQYHEIIDIIVIYQTAMKYKVGLIIFFAGIEYVMYYKKKINAFKNFTKVQIKSIDKYVPYLFNFVKSFHDGKKERNDPSEEWSPFSSFLFNIATSIFTFGSIQGLAQSFGHGVPESLLKEADKFISPGDCPVKYKSDGIADVPIPPTGIQDPNVILSKAETVIDWYEGLQNPTADAEPVEMKKPKSDYDDVYE